MRVKRKKHISKEEKKLKHGAIYIRTTINIYAIEYWYYLVSKDKTKTNTHIHSDACNVQLSEWWQVIQFWTRYYQKK